MGKQRGKFIVIEGVDCSGKTTQARRLVAALRRRGIDVLAVREPGGTAVSERVRRILLSHKGKITARTELLLYLAARAQVVAEKIAPALPAGKVVVADRFSLSTYAYQIGGRGLPPEVVLMADQFARDGLQPDLTFVLDVSPAEARRRLAASGKKPDRMERQGAAFFARIRRYYRQATRKRPTTILLDADCDPDTLAEVMLARVLRLVR